MSSYDPKIKHWVCMVYGTMTTMTVHSAIDRYTCYQRWYDTMNTKTATGRVPKNRFRTGAGSCNIHSTSSSSSSSSSATTTALPRPSRSRSRTQRYDYYYECSFGLLPVRRRVVVAPTWDRWIMWRWCSMIVLMMMIILFIVVSSCCSSHHHGESLWCKWWWWPTLQSWNDVTDKDAPPLSVLVVTTTTTTTTTTNHNHARLDLSTILQETICPQESSLLNLHHSSSGHDDVAIQIRQWTIRLLYAVIHEQQHPHHNDKHKYLILSLSPNGLGANLRLGLIPILQLGMVLNRTVLVLNDFGSGHHDADENETSDFKQSIPKSLLQPWPLASCRDPSTHDSPTYHPTSHHQYNASLRNDYQCFFRPISSGTMTPDNFRRHTRYDPTIHHAMIRSNHSHNDKEHDYYYYILPRQEIRYLFRHGQFRHREMHDMRILMVPVNFRPQRQPPNLPWILHQRAQSLVVQQSQFHSVAPSILHRAVDAILTMDFNDNNDNRNITTTTSTTNDDFNYYGANSVIYHSFLLYTLRPNPHVQEQLDAIVRPNIIPHHADRDSVTTFTPPNHHHHHNNNSTSSSHIVIGLPIRASDKCRSGESECLPSFRDYLDAAHDRTLSLPHHSHPTVRVIVTTESKAIRDEMQDYQRQQQQHPSSQLPIDRSYDYKLITNPLDVTQDTGYFEDRTKHQSPNQSVFMGDPTANDIMISTLSSLQLQLYATHLTVGNCCSNFHLILKDLLHIGCGVAAAHDDDHHHHHQFQCLQNHPNPQYRVCCSWDKSVTCQNKRRQTNEWYI